MQGPGEMIVSTVASSLGQYSDELLGIDSGLQTSWRVSGLSTIFLVNSIFGQTRVVYNPKSELLEDVSIICNSASYSNPTWEP